MSPLSRRDFIASAIAAGGAIVAPESAYGEDRLDQVPSLTMEPHTVRSVDAELTINGVQHSLANMDVNATLLDCLRDALHLTGTKKGCGLGQCGACTVLVDGRRVNACLCLAVMQQGKQITTIESIGAEGELHVLQSAFIRHDAFQCGYCTSGQIMSGLACIHEGHTRTEDEIREWMSGNLCRCGAYTNIVAAVSEAARGSVPK